MKAENYKIIDFKDRKSAEWDNLLFSYSDYSIYQSYAWGELKQKHGWSPLMLIFYFGNNDIGMLQCIYKFYMLFNAYVIWVPGGPVFMRETNTDRINNLCYMLKALCERFNKSRYYLRVYPGQDYASDIVLCLRELGFQRPMQNISSNLTYHINTLRSQEALLGDFSSNWRHNLSRSSRQTLILNKSFSQQDFASFYKIYSEASKSKKIKAIFSCSDFEFLKGKLTGPNALSLFLASSGGEIFAARMIGVVNKKAYDLAAALSYKGRKSYAGYFLLWEIIKWCGDNGIEYFDLSGADPYLSKDVFNFKKGLGGKLVEYVGEWEFSNNFILRAAVNCFVRKFVRC